ncbi:MAG: preprotein translocase subunit YajC [bacterium]|nr:preprotein translocase subunit YajC [bacterium]
MLFFLAQPAYAMGGGAGGGADGNPIAQLLPFVLMFVVLYFLILRPQIKKQKTQQKMIDELQKGDKIVTSGGLHGVITNLKDDIITVKIAENVRVDMSRAAVSRVREDGDDKSEKSDK